MYDDGVYVDITTLNQKLKDANEQVAVFASGSPFEQTNNALGLMGSPLASLDFEGGDIGLDVQFGLQTMIRGCKFNIQNLFALVGVPNVRFRYALADERVRTLRLI